MEQKCDTDHPNWSRNVDTEERLFKRVLKAYRYDDDPKLNRFTIMTDDGLAYDDAYCPSCGMAFDSTDVLIWEGNYCPECGQRLDWKMDEKESHE